MDDRYLEKILEETDSYQNRKNTLNKEIKELYRVKQTKEVNKKMARLNSELAQLRRPVSFGRESAARAWLNGKRYAQTGAGSEPVLRSIGVTWAEDFLITLREAGVESFFFQGDGTNGFDAMMTFAENGCEFAGFARKQATGEEGAEIKGIRFMLK